MVVPSGVTIPSQYLKRVIEGLNARGESVAECSTENVTVVNDGKTAPFAAELLRTSAI